MGDEVAVGSGDKIKKIKAKGWRWCRCGCVFLSLALAFTIVGIALLVHFGHGLLDKENDNTAYGVSIFAIILLLLAFVVLLIGIGFCTCMYIIYRKMTKKPGGLHYDPPQYDYGKAPYPQQDWGNMTGPAGQGHQQPIQGSAPPPDGPVDTAAIVPEIKIKS